MGKTIASVAFISLVSRFLSLISQIIYISYFGNTVEMGIFSYALNMPNIIFNCMGTALNLVIIPVYTSLLVRDDKKGAEDFINNIITMAGALIFAIVALGMIFAPAIGQITDYKNNPEEFNFLVYSLRVLMPVMLFYGLNYILQGMLQSNGIFKLPAFVALPTSVITILYTIILGDKFGERGLLFASLTGLMAQPLILIPAVIKLGYRFRPQWDYKNPYVRNAFSQIGPVLISASSYQINMLFNSTMATSFNTVVFMNFSQQLVVTSVLTIIYSITGVYFPKLTRLWALDEKKEFSNILREILSLVIFILIPAGAGFFYLRFEIIDFLLNYKSINSENVIVAGNILGIYGIGVLFIGLKEVLDRAFYSQKDAKTPAKYGFVIMAVNIFVTFLLLSPMGKYSMPAAYSIAAAAGAIGLFISINKGAHIINKAMAVNALKCILSAILMLLAINIVKSFTIDLKVGGEFLTRAVNIILLVSVGVLTYFIAAFILKISQVKTLVKGIIKRG